MVMRCGLLPRFFLTTNFQDAYRDGYLPTVIAIFLPWWLSSYHDGYLPTMVAICPMWETALESNARQSVS
jgi:hypothetical protein